jgi:hypothetical protein
MFDDAQAPSPLASHGVPPVRARRTLDHRRVASRAMPPAGSSPVSSHGVRTDLPRRRSNEAALKVLLVLLAANELSGDLRGGLCVGSKGFPYSKGIIERFDCGLAYQSRGCAHRRRGRAGAQRRTVPRWSPRGASSVQNVIPWGVHGAEHVHADAALVQRGAAITSAPPPRARRVPARRSGSGVPPSR